MKIIAGADFLKFENIKPEDIQDLYYEIPILRTSTEITLDELMSARQNTMALFEQNVFSARRKDTQNNNALSVHKEDSLLDKKSDEFENGYGNNIKIDTLEDLKEQKQIEDLIEQVEQSRQQQEQQPIVS